MDIDAVRRTDLLDTRQNLSRIERDIRLVTPTPLLNPSLSPLELLQSRCDQAAEFCSAQSAGVSIFRPDGFDELTWVVTSGQLGRYTQRRFPRTASPCGVCFEYRAPQLFLKPEHYFPWMKEAGIVAREWLVAPIVGSYGAFVGTIWVVSHSHDTKFDRQDANVLLMLGKTMDHGHQTGNSGTCRARNRRGRALTCRVWRCGARGCVRQGTRSTGGCGFVKGGANLVFRPALSCHGPDSLAAPLHQRQLGARPAS